MTNELEMRREIQSRWRPVVRAFGLDEPKHEAADTYFLATAIMNDREVDRMMMLPEFQIVDDPEFTCAVRTDWAKLGTALGPAGRAELAERVKRSRV